VRPPELGRRLVDLIRQAYDVKSYQVSGPDWIKEQRYGVQAKIPEGVSRDQHFSQVSQRHLPLQVKSAVGVHLYRSGSGTHHGGLALAELPKLNCRVVMADPASGTANGVPIDPGAARALADRCRWSRASV
jgi:hypothetical protein